MHMKNSNLLFIALSVVLISGCAEGMFWKTGYMAPWVRQQWSAEEEIAATFFARQEKMAEVVAKANTGSLASQEKASEYLAEIVANDPVLLMRIEATQLLGELSTETAELALQTAARDREIEVRKAAVKSLSELDSDLASQLLNQMALQDADTDVRLAATRSLALFPGTNSQQTLADVLNDPNPALQLRAAEALTEITNEDFGRDILAWQEYLAKVNQQADENRDRTANEDGESSHPKFR